MGLGLIKRDSLAANTDEDLLYAARSGESEAFGVFYDRHAHAIFRYFVKRTASTELAADLTSESFARALLGLHRFRYKKVPPLAWLYGISKRVLGQYLRNGQVEARARHRLNIRPVELAEDEFERVEQLLDAPSVKHELDKAIGSLSDGVAKAVRMRVTERLSYGEIANHLGCSESAARVRVSRGLSTLAERLKQR